MCDDTPTMVEPNDDPANDRARGWVPTAGAETEEFLEAIVPRASREAVRDAAVSILGRGVSPVEIARQETGLVVGYVQSGKTMSFEAVAAVARDSEFQFVIVVAGTSIPLLEQSTGRLRRDLRLDDFSRARRWIQFQNPDSDDATVQAIRDALADWRDRATPAAYRRSVLVTVLKHHRRLQNLATLVGRLDMQGVPTLIIDDEADQASLNTEVAQGQESSTYRRLMELRQAIPSHTYLQYTATPQAPLLVSIIDSLSPNFVQVLQPGDAYVGGREFFGTDPRYVRVIPAPDVPVRTNPLPDAPDSLLAALRVFMVGVAVGLPANNNAGNRSMLVHPSHRTAQHHVFYRWVRNIFEEWKRVLALQDDDPDKRELIEEFRDAHQDLMGTVGQEMPPFDELAPSLSFAFRNTRVLEVNARAGRTPAVDWRSAYGWILVGGQAMDRGFTVEGLTVTYMPRGIGVGNADTVQQRARFFGYKRPYLGYCRLYLEQGTLRAFQSYVEHEEDVRRQLLDYQNTGRALDEWKRAFILDAAMRPCRQQVLAFDYMRGQFRDDWVAPNVLLASATVNDTNRAVVGDFLRGMPFVDDDGDPRRTDTQRHRVCRDVPLREVVENLLVRVRLTGAVDSQRNTGMLLQLSRALDEDPDLRCTVFQMSPGVQRTRGIDENGEVTNIFQGAAPVYPRERRGEVYPGDLEMRDENTVGVQIHRLALTREDAVVMDDVPVIAVWVPAQLARGWVAQEQATPE